MSRTHHDKSNRHLDDVAREGVVHSQVAPLKPLLLDYRAAADYLGGIPIETVRSWVKRGIFRRVRIGRRSFIPRREIDEFVQKQLDEDCEGES